MNTITYLYALGQSVYFIDEVLKQIHNVIVKSVSIQVLYGVTIITYVVAYTDASGTHTAPEADLFVDADSALAAYKLKYL